jgi:hypothetical protein
VEQQVVELTVSLAPHREALQRVTSLLHRKSVEVMALVFADGRADITVALAAERAWHIVESLRKEVLVLSVELHLLGEVVNPGIGERPVRTVASR